MIVRNELDSRILNMLYKGTTTPQEFNWDQMSTVPLLSLMSIYDINYVNKIIMSPRYSGNNRLKMDKIDEVMHYNGFSRFAGGTNRLVYTHPYAPNAVTKVAIDSVGINDNPAEYKNQQYIKPFCCKVFECSPCGTIASFEKVDRITTFEEFYSIADDYFYLLSRIILGRYVMEDIGIDYFMNVGIRRGFGPVLLDFPYLFQLDGKKLECMNQLDDGSICHGEISYDPGFNQLICTKCHRKYRARDLAKPPEAGGILLRQEGGRRMKFSLTKGNTVVKSYDTTVEKEFISKTNGIEPNTSPVVQLIKTKVNMTTPAKVSNSTPTKGNTSNHSSATSAKPAEIKIKTLELSMPKSTDTVVKSTTSTKVPKVIISKEPVHADTQKTVDRSRKVEKVTQTNNSATNNNKTILEKIVNVELKSPFESKVVKADKSDTPKVSIDLQKNVSNDSTSNTNKSLDKDATANNGSNETESILTTIAEPVQAITFIDEESTVKKDSKDSDIDTVSMEDQKISDDISAICDAIYASKGSNTNIKIITKPSKSYPDRKAITEFYAKSHLTMANGDIVVITDNQMCYTRASGKWFEIKPFADVNKKNKEESTAKEIDKDQTITDVAITEEMVKASNEEYQKLVESSSNESVEVISTPEDDIADESKSTADEEDNSSKVDDQSSESEFYDIRFVKSFPSINESEPDVFYCHPISSDCDLEYWRSLNIQDPTLIDDSIFQICIRTDYGTLARIIYNKEIGEWEYYQDDDIKNDLNNLQTQISENDIIEEN